MLVEKEQGGMENLARAYIDRQSVAMRLDIDIFIFKVGQFRNHTITL